MSCESVCICLVSFVSRLRLLCVHVFISDGLDASHALRLLSVCFSRLGSRAGYY